MDEPTTTIDIHDRLDDLREQLAVDKQRCKELEAKAQGVTPGEDLTHEEAADMQAEYQDVCEDVIEWRFTIARIERSLAEWAGHGFPDAADADLEALEDALDGIDVSELDGEFVIRQFRYGARNQINDKLRTDAVRDGTDDPRTKLGAYELHIIDHGLVEVPDGAPHEPAEYDAPVGTWLNENIERYNSRGETKVRDFSLFRQNASNTTPRS